MNRWQAEFSMVTARSKRSGMAKSRMSASMTARSCPAALACAAANAHIAGERSSAAARRPRRASSRACSAGPAASSRTERTPPSFV